jgi:hypothetical protein
VVLDLVVVVVVVLLDAMVGGLVLVGGVAVVVVVTTRFGGSVGANSAVADALALGSSGGHGGPTVKMIVTLRSTSAELPGFQLMISQTASVSPTAFLSKDGSIGGQGERSPQESFQSWFRRFSICS